MNSGAKPPGGRFFGILSMGVLALCAGYAALVLHSATWAEVRQLDAIFPFYKWRIRLFSAAELNRVRELLTGGALALGAAAGILLADPAGRAECRQ